MRPPMSDALTDIKLERNPLHMHWFQIIGVCNSGLVVKNEKIHNTGPNKWNGDLRYHITKNKLGGIFSNANSIIYDLWVHMAVYILTRLPY